MLPFGPFFVTLLLETGSSANETFHGGKYLRTPRYRHRLFAVSNIVRYCAYTSVNFRLSFIAMSEQQVSGSTTRRIVIFFFFEKSVQTREILRKFRKQSNTDELSKSRIFEWYKPRSRFNIERLFIRVS